MRILYVTEVYPDPKRGIGIWGGGERNFYEISRRVAKRKHEVMVLTRKFLNQPSQEIIENIKIIRAGLSGEPYVASARAVPSLISYILESTIKAVKLAPNVIHCNTYLPVYVGKITSQLTNIPLVITFHDIYGLQGWIESQNSLLWGYLGHVITLIAAKLSGGCIITVSPQTKQKLIKLGVPEEKIEIVPNGVDLELFDSTIVEKIPNQILYVGRLVNFKHVDWLILAFNEVVKEIPDAKLKIVGGGPERANLEKLAKKLGLLDKVIFTGVIPTYEAVVRHYKESEVFVLPSTLEGEGIVLKEAMAAALPVIAINLRTSGVISVVQDGENGFLVEPNQPKLIADKLIQLLQDKELRKKMGERGRKFIEKYDWEVITTRVLGIYQQIIENR